MSNYRTYKTPEKTIYRLGQTRASWSDLKVGEIVIEVTGSMKFRVDTEIIRCFIDALL
jgi:hypothetical protein